MWLLIRQQRLPGSSPHHHVWALPRPHQSHSSGRKGCYHRWEATDPCYDLWDVRSQRHAAQHQGHRKRLLPAGVVWWHWFRTMWSGCVVFCCTVLSLWWSLKPTVSTGSKRLLGHHEAIIPGDRQPPTDCQVLLHPHLSPVWGRYSHWTQFFDTSLLSPYAQPLHHPSTRLWGKIVSVFGSNSQSWNTELSK